VNCTPPNPADDAVTLLATHGRAVDAALKRLRERYAVDAPSTLLDAIDYSLLAGGKRMRPTLVLESCRACGGDPQSNPSAIAAAVAMELVHTFSLVHDDLPAMDNDDLRRGRPTNHKVFGDAMAILAGDAMTTMAFDVLATDAEPAIAASLVAELAKAAGPAGMIGGQVLDMAGEHQQLTLEQLRQVHRLKTGALITASCRMGAIAVGGRGPLDAITAFGKHLGLAFQIVDDILDLTSTPAQLGKQTGKDAAKGKNTYPGLIGLDESRERARAELNAAISAISHLGPQSCGLLALARFVVDRER
jgi:geranylgeranyl diphosphate synthase type II